MCEQACTQRCLFSSAKRRAALERWYSLENADTHLEGWFKDLDLRGRLFNGLNSKIAFFSTKIEEYVIFRSKKSRETSLRRSKYLQPLFQGESGVRKALGPG